jgi:hypothetical protein
MIASACVSASAAPGDRSAQPFDRSDESRARSRAGRGIVTA